MSARVLFHCPSRRGLGHLMRGTNLARAVRALDPSADVLLHASSDAARELVGDDIPWTSADGVTRERWRAVVSIFRPTLVLFDTMLPAEWAQDDAPRGFVWRHCVADRHEDMVHDPRLGRMQVVVVPHHRHAVDYGLPDELERRTVYSGPIVRESTPEGRARVRARYGLREDDFVLTSTCGGGGFESSANWLVDTALAAHEALVTRVERLRHVVVMGPLSPLAAPRMRPGLTTVAVEPDLVDLMAVSDLVVAEAGYNTVAELEQLGVPAVLLPGARAYDDQVARAAALAARGVACAVGRESAHRAVEAIVRLVLGADERRAMRARAESARPVCGNVIAARAILDAARVRAHVVGGAGRS